MRKLIALALSIICVLFFVNATNAEKPAPMFTGQEDHNVTLQEAKEFMGRYQEIVEPGERIGGFFGGETIQAILDQDQVVGIRYYYGLDSEGKRVLVLVGTDEKGKDIWTGKIAELSRPCPPNCDEEAYVVKPEALVAK
jgi:ABC-type dipeptide/oligopeptide/nickel transport system permease subunit